MRKKHAFTLIELLVVVAIIAILAAIAVPNFLEAQTRAKVSRVKADLRTIATALEAYTVDTNRVPHDGFYGESHFGWVNSQKQLTTPIAYLTSIPVDPFQDSQFPDTDRLGHTHFIDSRHVYDYGSARWHGVGTIPNPQYAKNFTNSAWKVGSCGPDKRFEDNGSFYGMEDFYDATNGTVSGGDVYRSRLKQH